MRGSHLETKVRFGLKFTLDPLEWISKVSSYWVLSKFHTFSLILDCPKTCQSCSSSSNISCNDKLPEKCRALPKTYCSTLKDYMAVNCQKYCGLCSNGLLPPPKIANAQSACNNAKPKLCNSLGARKCQFTKYKASMKRDCRELCGYCQ